METYEHCMAQVLGPSLIFSRQSNTTFLGLARTVYGCMYGDFPAKNTVYAPYIYGPGQPYTFFKLQRESPLSNVILFCNAGGCQCAMCGLGLVVCRVLSHSLRFEMLRVTF